MPGGFIPPEQIKGIGVPGGPGPAGASAGTQAEDALTMKRMYQSAPSFS